jgi:hypothetical protein
VRVPIRPRHIAILFRNFRNFGADVTRPYVRALGPLDQRREGLVRSAAPRESSTLCPLAAMPWQRPNIGSRMNREVHVRFWERPRVKVPRATRQKRRFDLLPATSGLTPINGPRQTGPAGPVRAKTGLMKRSNSQLHSITWSTRASSIAGRSRPRTLSPPLRCHTVVVNFTV